MTDLPSASLSLTPVASRRLSQEERELPSCAWGGGSGAACSDKHRRAWRRCLFLKGISYNDSDP